MNELTAYIPTHPGAVIKEEFALSVEAALGISADLLGRMQTRYNFTLARKDQKTLARLDAIRNICASLL